MKEEKTEPIADDCHALMKELLLTPTTGAIGVSSDGFFVIIFNKVKKPPLIKFRGWPITYRIGGGMPRALNAEK